MSIRIIGYSADEEGFFRHGGQLTKLKIKIVPFKKNIKNYARLHCCYCKCQLSEENYTRDHIIPLARGGTNRMRNKRQCCYLCNQDKGDRLLTEWLVILQERHLELNMGTEEYRINQRKIGRCIHYIQLL
jgi:hypothetical protein